MTRIAAYGALTPSLPSHLSFMRNSIAAQTGAPSGTLQNIAHSLDTTAALFVGGALDIGTGQAILCPASATRFGHFDPSNDTFSLGATHDQGVGAYSGLIPIDEDLMVAVPSSADFIGRYNPRTKFFEADRSLSAAIGSTASNLFAGGALTPSGICVFAPKAHTNIGLYNAATRRYNNGPANPSANGYAGAQALHGNWVVLIPDGTGPVVLVNSVSGEVQVSSSGTLAQCKGAVISPLDGRVIFVSNAATRLITYDPVSNTYNSSPAQISSATGKFWGGAPLPDGKIVFAPQNYGAPLIVDPILGTWADGPAMPGTNLSAGALALPDGRVLFIPNRNANLVLYKHLTGTQGLPRNALSSRHFNKGF